MVQHCNQLLILVTSIFGASSLISCSKHIFVESSESIVWNNSEYAQNHAELETNLSICL